MIWQNILTTSLIGTERKPLNLNPADDKIGQLLAQLNYSDPEGSLLSAAAITSLYQKAGKIPLTDNQPILTPCQPEPDDNYSPISEPYLKILLTKARQQLLPEWLAAAAIAEKQIPHHYLPEILEIGRQEPHLRSLILPVLGKRGRWLAAQNPDWDYVVGEDIEETWTTGTISARQLLLQQLRRQNPAAARERIAKVWAAEKSETRLAFLEIFSTNLSLNDQAFIETTLDDGYKEIRQKAAELLAQLPESSLCQRMAKQLRPLLILNEKRKKLYIDFNLTDFSTQEMTRDGIHNNKPPQLLGEKAWILLQMVAATPLSFWTELNQAKPTEWIQAAKRSEWDATLVDGWAVAASRQKNPDWAEVLLSIHSNFQGHLLEKDRLIASLIETLTSQLRDEFFVNLFQSNTIQFAGKNSILSLLHHHRYPWSQELTLATIKAIQNHLLQTTSHSYWSLRSALNDFAYYIPPTLLPEISIQLDNFVPQSPILASFWQETIDEFLALLNFRLEILKSLGIVKRSLQ